MQLRKPCEHDHYDEHPLCPGGSNATFDDLIIALQEQGIEGLVQVRYVGPEMTGGTFSIGTDTYPYDAVV